MTQRDVLVGWLNDAYATEQSLINVLEKHAQHAEGHPDIQRKYEAHLAQTRHHAEMVENCIKRLGSDTSAAKSLMGKFSGFIQGMSSGAADDALVKDCLADYSMEHFEIASYKGLIAGAEAIGETEIAETCRRILRDEEEMADWLESRLPNVAEEHVVTQNRD